MSAIFRQSLNDEMYEPYALWISSHLSCDISLTKGASCLHFFVATMIVWTPKTFARLFLWPSSDSPVRISFVATEVLGVGSMTTQSSPRKLQSLSRASLSTLLRLSVGDFGGSKVLLGFSTCFPPERLCLASCSLLHLFGGCFRLR